MKTLFAVVIVLFSISAFSQSTEEHRFIEVSGDGEVKVDPNILYLAIELREHKEGGRTVKIEELESRLVKILEAAGIPKDNLKVYGASGRQSTYLLKSGLNVGKRYTLKLTDLDALNPVLADLSEAKILSVWVSEVTHTEIDKFKEAAKIKAITDAKRKATLLTDALEGELGQVIQIRETERNDYFPREMYQRSAYNYGVDQYRYLAQDAKYASNDVDFEHIKLTYKIVVKFEIL